LLVVVEAITNDELIGDVHGLIIDRIIVLERIRLKEQGGDANIGGVELMELLDGIFHRVASIDDIFHDDHVAAFKGVVETDEFTHHIGGLGTRIGREFHERDLAWDGKALEQLGGKHKGSVEHHKEQRILAGQVGIQLIRHRLDGILDFLLRDVKRELFV